MATKQTSKSQKIVLVVLMVGLAFLVARKYLNMLELPTNGRIEEALQTLKSRQGDLAVQRKMAEDWQANLAALRAKAGIFWRRQKPGVPPEQEVLDEFNELARLASVNIQTKEPKLLKVPNSNYVQEVELRLDMRGITMREFTRILREIDMSKRRFFWTMCRVEPDNLQKPTGLRVSARLKAYVLSEDGSKLLAAQPTATAAPAVKAPAKSVAAGKAVPAKRMMVPTAKKTVTK